MTMTEFYELWHKCKDILSGADAHIHEEFDESWADKALALLTDEQRKRVGDCMESMASNYETFGSLRDLS